MCMILLIWMVLMTFKKHIINFKEFTKYAKKSIRLEAKLEESNKLVEKYKEIAEKSLEKLN